MKNDFVGILKKRFNLNLSKDEHNAFFELLNNGYTQCIIIRPAYKGSGKVITDRDAYVSSLEDQMTTSQSYAVTDGDATEGTYKNVKRLVQGMCNNILELPI